MDHTRFIDGLSEDQPKRLPLLGGSEEEGYGYEGDYDDYYEGDEGEYMDNMGSMPIGTTLNTYFWPYGLNSDNQFEDSITVYGTNFRGVNLFGLYFWGVVMTVIMELIYIFISHSMWSRTKSFNYGDAGDVSWQFSKLGVTHTRSMFYCIWGIVCFLIFISGFVRSSMNPDRKEIILGNSFTSMLLVLTFLPAGYAGGWWENEMASLQFDNPDFSYDNPGHILLVIVPILWPMISNCLLVVGIILMGVGSTLRSLYLPYDDEGYYDEGDEGDWNEGDYEGDYDVDS